MLTKFLFSLLFDAPGDKGAAPIVTITGSDDKDDLKGDLDLLGNEDDDKDNKDDDTSPDDDDKDDDDDGDNRDGKDDDGDKDEDKDKDDEDKEGEENEDDEDKDKLPKNKRKEPKEEDDEDDLVRHSYSAIKKEYPELFKKFPGLKQAFFREQEFTKIFPTIDEAKAAVQAQENFVSVRDAVMSGDAKSFLEQVKEASPEALDKFSSNFLADLRDVNKDVYIEVTTPVIKNILLSALKSGASKKDENLIAAAKVVHQAIFGGEYDDIEKGNETRARREEDPDRIKLNKERDEFYQGKYQMLMKEVWTDVSSNITREIEKGLDPTNSIRPGLKKILLDKIFDEVTDKVSKDVDHVKRMNDLWARERRNGFNGQLKDSLKTTYLSRAKALIPAIRQRIRAEAVETQKSNDKDKAKKVTDNNRDRRPDAGRQAGSGKKTITAKEANQKRMSDLDILNS